MSSPRPRVVISGIGVVSPFGVGRDRFWDAVSCGVSGIRPITEFDASPFSNRVSGAVPLDVLRAAGVELDEAADESSTNGHHRANGNGRVNGNGRADPRRYAKVSRIAVIAAREALQDAGIAEGDPDLGVMVGSGAGGIDVAERQYGEFFSGAFHRVSP